LRFIVTTIDVRLGRILDTFLDLPCNMDLLFQCIVLTSSYIGHHL
jgi:hypothetical protein